MNANHGLSIATSTTVHGTHRVWAAWRVSGLTRSALGCALTLWLALSSGVAGETLNVTDHGSTRYVITLPADPAAPVRTAATELQSFLQQVTGARFPIQSEADTPDDAPQIVLGPSTQCRQLLPDIEPEQLPHDTIIIKAVGNKLVLTGRPPRGTLYAVYSLLEDVVGCRWWTSNESWIPKTPSLHITATLDIQHTPPLRYREAFYEDTFDGPTAARFKLNGHHHRVGPEYGGHYQFVGFVHTFYPFLPPAKYFADHPEWYSEIDGKRTATQAQLCLTNAEMRAEMVKVVLERLRSQPEAGFVSISQNDWHGRCLCDACRAWRQKKARPPDR